MKPNSDSISFQTPNHALGDLFQRALDGLRANVRPIQGFEVLIEGAEYDGIWLECGPHEAALYAQLNNCQIPVALSSHRAFFALQREDGYFPYNIKSQTLGTAQIQSVVSIAETAWRTWQLSGDIEFLKQAYAACVRWDAWLGRYRDTRGSGLCEAFCEFDTGHDKSPRFHGFPRRCPDDDARLCPDIPRAPLIAPDLSASRMGGQWALAKMARALNRLPEAQGWEESAETMRLQIIAKCYDADQACFFDVDNHGDFVRVRGDILMRVLDEGVVSPEVFETIYTRQIRNPAAFWTPFPLPSIAADDPHFVHDLPHNSWGGASQALTAMRAPRLFNRYGKRADLAHLMERWIAAISRYGGFSQQMNPWTGEFDGQGRDYSPAMLVLLDFATRLHGIRREDGVLRWGCGLPSEATESCYQAEFPGLKVSLEQNCAGATLKLNSRTLVRVNGSCQIVTSESGALQSLIGLTSETVTIVDYEGKTRRFRCTPDEEIPL